MPRVAGVMQLLSGTLGVPNTTIQSAPYNAQQNDWVLEANSARPVTAGGTEATTAGGAITNLVNTLTAKATPIDADLIPIVDTAASNVGKKVTLANLKEYLGLVAALPYGGGSGLRLVSTAADSNAGPNIELMRDSASPAALDFLSQIYLLGRDAAAAIVPYARVFGQIVGTGAGSHSGSLSFQIWTGGSPITVLKMEGGANGAKFGATVMPSTDDGFALGTSANQWSDAYFASGAVITFAATNYTITHSSGLLSFSAAMTIAGNFISSAGNITTTTGSFFCPAGNVSVGTWHASGATAGVTISNAAAYNSSCTVTSAFSHARWTNPNGLVGTIQTNGSATAYNTSSDKRRKTNLRTFDGGSILDRLEVWLFDWKKEWGGASGYGVMAQDAIKVFPDAVSNADDDWGVDYSKYVPLLIAEVQALRKRVAQLEG